MARIHIDANGLQAGQHLDAIKRGSAKGRLTTFLEAVGSTGSVSFSQDAPIDGVELSGKDMLIITTRPPRSPYSASEIEAIHDFVATGSSLLLMANHSNTPARPSGPSFTEQDGRLVERFGVRLLDACFQDPGPGGLTSLQTTGEKTHPILLDSSGSRNVHSLEINSCSAVSNRSENGRPVLLLADSMVDLGFEGHSPLGEAFAWSVESYGEGGGRVVVMGDSGFIGEPNLPGTGPGLIDMAQNRLFVTATVEWLLHTD